ncbi:AraC family transcriptional regulator [Sphingosinicella microcystinivorans]|jgi:AraC-like DNA-binding protein|uniref:AraC family transcriptional regulator n=1 Tax=Sphingosinicella microcystinivorans TaxID=335406 RepID=A0ABX9SUA6_SPHMI|nr:helix-turn-helix domain-containing protein [Sphingosinicella microcystinivorans]RKS84403.1 AraC family transcriptional regulator [Sphingosinicella microcystinivorans]
MTDLAHWKGRLRIGDFLACWSGSVGDAVPHRHFAAQAVFADDPVEVTDSHGQRYIGRCLLIEPEVVHCLLPASEAELWYVEPTIQFGPPVDLRARPNGAKPIHVVSDRGTGFWKAWLALEPRRPLDARIVQAVRLADAGRESGLSLGRFRHLFTAKIGMPFQRYVLWRRLLIAFEAIGRQRGATEAAHMAGFSDSAHFARTIKAMFGICASDLMIEG